MQQHYIDICLRADPELDPAHIMTALYTRLHRALVQMPSGSIGVSFPDYDASVPTVGKRLRLIGPEADLIQLDASPWTGATRDHVVLAAIQPVPPNPPHRTLRRIQVKSSPMRLRRRLMKRHQLTEAQALQRIPHAAARYVALPYIALSSASTGQPFRLFLALSAQAPTPVAGRFNAYGLSSGATIPWF